MPDAFKRVFATGPTGTLMLDVNGPVWFAATHVPWPRQTCATTWRGGYTCLRLPAVKLWTPRHALPRVTDASVATFSTQTRRISGKPARHHAARLAYMRFCTGKMILIQVQ